MTQNVGTAIIGAGLAGLSAAFHLGEGYTIFEAEDEVGGHTRSQEVEGFIFDQGIHVLHTLDPGLIDLLTGLGVRFVTRQRSAWLYFRGCLTRYPIQANTFGLPVDIVRDCLLGIIRAHCEPPAHPPANYAEWLLATFGSGVASHFLLPYASKFWTVPATDLNLDWIDVRVPKPSLEESIAGALSDQTKGFGPNAFFRYPMTGGIHALPQALARQLNGPILTGKRLSLLDPLEHSLTFADGTSYQYDQVIFTMPLPIFAKLVVGLPDELRRSADHLRYTSILCVNVAVEREAITDKHWIYFPEDDYVFSRISFPMNYAPGLAPAGYSSISAEIAYSDREPMDITAATQRVIPELRQAGVIQANDRARVIGVDNVAYAYVIYDHQWKTTTQALSSHLRALELYPCGRFGEWAYLWMHDVIQHGEAVADLIKLKRVRGVYQASGGKGDKSY